MQFKDLTDEFCSIPIVVGAVDKSEQGAETVLPVIVSWHRIGASTIAEEQIAEFHRVGPF